MTQSGGTSEAVYVQLKAALIEGTIESHARLDIAQLAQSLGVSSTPVREAAMRLLGEGLLEMHPRGGMRPPLVSEFRLRALLELHARLLTLALDWASPDMIAHIRTCPAVSREDEYRQLFAAIVETPGNPELKVIFNHLADRLAAFRFAEQEIFSDVDHELQALRAAIASRSAASLKRCLKSYHRRRIAQVAQLAWLAARELPLAKST